MPPKSADQRIAPATKEMIQPRPTSSCSSLFSSMCKIKNNSPDVKMYSQCGESIATSIHLYTK